MNFANLKNFNGLLVKFLKLMNIELEFSEFSGIS